MTYRGDGMTAAERVAEILERKRQDLAFRALQLKQTDLPPSLRHLHMGLRDELFLEIWALETARRLSELPDLPSQRREVAV